MCDPIGILVENGIVQVAHLKFKIGIDDRFDLIVILHRFKPEFYRTLKLFIRLVFRFMLHVKHRWKISVLQFHVLQEMSSLLMGWCMNTIEMVGTTRKTMFARLIEVITEILICLRGSLCSFDHYKTDGTLVNTTIILQFIPVNTSLMM